MKDRKQTAPSRSRLGNGSLQSRDRQGAVVLTQFADRGQARTG
jgi:hypothetical protein